MPRRTKASSPAFRQPAARLFVPDGTPARQALPRVTHLGIGAHHDDLEFMALQGILNCFDSHEEWFGGVTCSDGARSARTGPYAHHSDAQMIAVRQREQDLAATVGRYGAMVQLGYPSRTFQGPTDPSLHEDLMTVLDWTRPRVIYTHNLADKHATHIGVVIAVLEAVRQMPHRHRPHQLIGCEVWRGLDWLADDRKLPMDVSGREHLCAALSGVFDSQISGGKRYDLATAGRRAANATFFQSHATDHASQLIWGMDLTPLIENKDADIASFIASFIEEFKQDVVTKIQSHLHKKSVVNKKR